ncbi:MAG: hypothetical protein ABGY41_18060 [Candidatus Poribacteria bacterium]
MSQVSFLSTVPLNGSIDVSLAPFDRFGGGGGRVAIRATTPAGTLVGITATMIVGSDVIVNNGHVLAEKIAGGGPDADTPAFMGFGAVGDPITFTLSNSTIADIVVLGIADIQNA